MNIKLRSSNSRLASFYLAFTSTNQLNLMGKLFAIFQIACLASMLCFGCNLSEKDKDVVVKIEPEFLLGMKEELSQSRDFNLTFKTIHDQSCISNMINFTSNRSNNSLNLNLVEILETENCQLGEGPVESSASYDFLPIGTYHLDLNLKNTINSAGTLTVSNEKFTVEIEDGFGFQLNQNILMRVPNSTVWGYVAYKDNQHSAEADEFLNQLNLKTSNLKLGKGDYGYFSIGDNEKLSLQATPDYNNFKTFYRISSGQISELETLLESFRSQFSGGEMEFKIFTWQGQTI